MRFLLAILFLLPGTEFALKAQDLKGQWTGGSADNLSDTKQKLVLNIASADSLFGGVLHWYDPETQTVRHFLISGLYHAKDSILFLLQDGVTSNQAGFPAQHSADAMPDAAADTTIGFGKGIFVLYYRRVGHKELLDGHWRNPEGNSPGTGRGMTIRLEKKAPPFVPAAPIPRKKKDSVQQRQYTALLARETPVVATIPVHSLDSVRIDLYDNGEIDGDSISLYLNNDLILMHLQLQAQPKTLWIQIDRSLPVNKLVLFAENLGRLPPNTALMEVTIKGKLYNVFLSTDYKRNAMVAFTLTEN